MQGLFARLKFWLFWVTSSVVNFFILGAIRQFYLTSETDTTYYIEQASKLDAWVGFLLVFTCILLIYLLNAFYKEEINKRFLFISSLQLMILGIARIFSAPFAIHLDQEFEFTTRYVIISLASIILGVILYWYFKKFSKEKPTRMLRSLFRIRAKKFW